MSRNNSFTNQQADEDIFAEAVGRLEAGEPIEKIVTSYPAVDRSELFDLLAIVEVAVHIGQAPVPRPTAARRLTAKQSFLNAAAELRHEQQAESFVARKMVGNHSNAAWQDISKHLMGAIQSFFTIRTLRLAPLIVMLALVLLSTSTLVTMAQSAVPGDFAYTFKQWIRKQELELAPASQREYVRQVQERELAADVKKAAQKADNNSAIIQAEDTQIFYGRTGRILKIGALSVMDRYQPDGNVELFKSMTVKGDLQPGALVDLVYQIMPGQSDTVQGISLSVISPPTETPTPQPATVEPSVVQPQKAACTVTPPAGWVIYQVRPGDNLTYLAKLGNTTIGELMQVNCLQSETIWIDAQLYVPADAVKANESGRLCSVEIPAGWISYKVQNGDNLSILAQRGNTTIDNLMRVNCLKSDTILIGSTLYAPSSATNSAP